MAMKQKEVEENSGYKPMSITINCDKCGKSQEQKPPEPSQHPKRLYSTLLTIMDYRPCATNKGVEKKEQHLCPKCTEELLKDMK